MSVCLPQAYNPLGLKLDFQSNNNFIYARRRQSFFCESLYLLLTRVFFYHLNNIRLKKPTGHAHLNRFEVPILKTCLGPLIGELGFAQVTIKEK